MRWSMHLGRFAGIDVRVHATFALLLAWFAYVSWTRTGTLTGVLTGLATILLLFLCVLLHEYGHALTARRYGIGTRHITLLPIGGLALLERMPRDPRQEIVVAFAGPAVNMMIAAALYLGLAAQNGTPPNLRYLLYEGGMTGTLLLANIFIAVFNLIPAFPMDGGRVFRALLSLRMDRLPATRIAAALGRVIALGFGAYGIWAGQVILTLIAVFIWFGAGAEARAVADAARRRRPTPAPMP